MEFKTATMEDFDLAFDYIEKLFENNKKDREVIKKVYKEVLENEDNFAFFLFEDSKVKGFCHGAYFNTFWFSGLTCYLSSIISNKEDRGKGYGRKLMDHAKELAEERGCKAIILDSAMRRKDAHRFYETYGFDKMGYSFTLQLD